MQSLTLAIWGACRTLDGPGFEPLISKASKLISFYGKASLVVGDVAQYARVVRALLFSWLPRVGGAAADGWNSATVALPPSVTAP